MRTKAPLEVVTRRVGTPQRESKLRASDGSMSRPEDWREPKVLPRKRGWKSTRHSKGAQTRARAELSTSVTEQTHLRRRDE